jgi:mycothiol synthase
VDVEVRAPRQEEAGAIAELVNAHAQSLFGVDAVTVEEIEHWFTIPTLDPDKDMRVAVGDGALLGYADVNDGGPERTRYWIDLRLRPGADGTVGDALVEAMERRAAEEAAPGALVRGFKAQDDEAASRVYEARGYRLIRHSLRMEASLAEEPEAPAWPEGISLRPAGADELPRIREAVEEAFADHWEYEPDSLEEWEHWASGPNTDRSLWFLAEDGGEIAGACLCRPHEAGDPEAGYVATLGVRPPWRRRGLALALLLHSFREFRRRGLPRVCLGVDAENTTGAVRLYEKAGMHIARRYDILEKPLD